MDGSAFHKQNDKMQHSLIMTALKYASQTTKEEAQALKKQRQHKLKTIATLNKVKYLKATEEYTRALILLETYHSVACWKTKEEVTRGYDKLTSETAKREAIKHQINIRTKGLGWTGMIHPWSKLGVMYTGDQLKAYFVNTILPFEENQIIPQVPNVNLPSRQQILSTTLGTMSHDVQKLNNK